MNNQRKLWNKLHRAGQASLRKQTDFAKELQETIPPQLKILELGCGSGNDSFYFAINGHHVLATDFSKVAIENNKKYFKQKNLVFEVLDISKPTNFTNNTFDVIYAHLSLHYFNEKITGEIFKELHRILKPNGLFCFLCKSTDDPLYDKGEQIEKDMFELDGHIRHFFSKEYIRQCLGRDFQIEELEIGEQTFYGNPSAFIKVIARKV